MLREEPKTQEAEMADERLNQEQQDQNQNQNPQADPATNPENGAEANDPNVDDMKSMLAKIARLEADAVRNKAALDKALKNNGELTKQLRQKMTASEQAEEAKKEQEEAQKQRIEELEAYKRRSEAKERYLMQGMSAELAKRAAEAEVAGDMEALSSIQQQNTNALVKAKEAEWLKNRPDINAGHGEEDEAAKLEREIAIAMGLSDTVK